MPEVANSWAEWRELLVAVNDNLKSDSKSTLPLEYNANNTQLRSKITKIIQDGFRSWMGHEFKAISSRKYNEKREYSYSLSYSFYEALNLLDTYTIEK